MQIRFLVSLLLLNLNLLYFMECLVDLFYLYLRYRFDLTLSKCISVEHNSFRVRAVHSFEILKGLKHDHAHLNASLLSFFLLNYGL